MPKPTCSESIVEGSCRAVILEGATAESFTSCLAAIDHLPYSHYYAECSVCFSSYFFFLLDLPSFF